MKRILAILIFVVFVACSSDDPARRIEKLEKQLFTTEQSVDPLVADDLVTAYCDYATHYPDDPMSPEYLFKAVDVSMNLNNPQRTIAIVDRMLRDYPDYPRTQAALFVKGFIFETYYGNLDMARKIYEQYLELYPNGEFADSCRSSIENLGLTPEELVRKFESQ
jgi:outer membrane protein assembly factor BamD (BamD/ComL family)